MGLDCPNVQYLIHTRFPFTLINYVQEVGRADRDGYRALAKMFVSLEDLLLLVGTIPELDIEMLRQMVGFIFFKKLSTPTPTNSHSQYPYHTLF